jgi:hypothetical protein
MQRANTIFCICFVGILLVWWFFLREYGNFVNRVGIILNFLSALMVSQDFVGSSFWANVEQVTERQLRKLESYLNRTMDLLDHFRVYDDRGKAKTKLETYKETVILLPISIFLGPVGFWWLLSNPLSLFLPLPITLLAVVLYYLLCSKHGNNLFCWSKKLTSKFPPLISVACSFVFGIICLISGFAVTIVASPLLSTIIFTALFTFLVFYPIVISLLTAMRVMAEMLSGNDKLREIVKYWGIIFFLLGSLLQFISTF